MDLPKRDKELLVFSEQLEQCQRVCLQGDFRNYFKCSNDCIVKACPTNKKLDLVFAKKISKCVNSCAGRFQSAILHLCSLFCLKDACPK